MLAVFTIVFAGCGMVDGSRACDDILLWGAWITAVDSASGALVPEERIVATAEAPGYSHTTDGHNPIPVIEDRPGTYTITVSAPGYSPWVKTEVEVGMSEGPPGATPRDPAGTDYYFGRCHVDPVYFEAKMQVQ